MFVIALARHEEVILERAYGERFRTYAAQVLSLVPRLTPVAAQGDVKPSLAQGLLAEVFTGAILLGIILAVVDRRRVELDFFVLYVAGIIAQHMIARAQVNARV